MDFYLKEKQWKFKDKIYLMGVLNMTPDSFYDGSKYDSYKNAISQADKLIKENVDVIDIGGESTRPGAEKISPEEEVKRILPVIKYIKKNHNIPLSVDTYKSEVASIVLKEGVEIINDISGLRFDKKMAEVIASHKASVILMHIKGTPKTMQKKPRYKNLIKEIIDYLAGSIKIAVDNGIQFNNIIIDPGIGFGKTVEQNYIILRELKKLKILNRPILIGLSRKSLIGKVLNNLPDERLAGTVALNTLSILNGANMIRVHDVSKHREVIQLMEYYFKSKKN